MTKIKNSASEFCCFYVRFSIKNKNMQYNFDVFEKNYYICSVFVR